MRQRHHVAVSAYWFATNLHWGALLVVMMPSQVKRVIAPMWHAQALSVILGVGALVALVTPPIVGAYSDRCASRWGRRRPYMAAGVALNLLGLLLMWTAGDRASFWLYLAAYLVVQFGNNLATASYSGIIPDVVPEAQRGEASGYMAAMTQMGTVLGAFASGYLMGAGYVTASYGLIGCTLVVFLGITAVGVREEPLARATGSVAWRNVLKSLWVNPRKHPDFAWVWLTRALVTMGMWCVQPYIQYYLGDVIGVPNPEQTTGLLLGTILIGATVTGLLGGSLSDRIGRKRVVYVANSLIAVASLAFLVSHSLAFTFVVGIVYGLGFGAYYSVDWALACDVLPSKDSAAKDMGVWHISMVLPQSLAPFIAGPLLAGVGRGPTPEHYTLPGYSAIFALAAFFLLLGALLLRNVRGVR
jgi:Na+/melibiose symporter-like transporter